jgi:hypothetical protein
MDSFYFSVQPGVMTEDNDTHHIVKASSINGGFTVVRAFAVADAVGTFNFVLQNYGTSGTVAGGTVAGHASGTAAVWAAATPQELAITAANAYIDADEWLVLKKPESAGGNDNGASAVVYIEYVPGVVTVG